MCVLVWDLLDRRACRLPAAEKERVLRWEQLLCPPVWVKGRGLWCDLSAHCPPTNPLPYSLCVLVWDLLGRRACLGCWLQYKHL